MEIPQFIRFPLPGKHRVSADAQLLRVHEPSSRQSLEIASELEKAQKALEKRFGTKFHGLVLGGSRATGRSRMQSDVDVVLLHHASDIEQESMIHVIERKVGRIGEFMVHVTSVNVEKAVRLAPSIDDEEQHLPDPFIVHSHILNGLGFGGKPLADYRQKLARVIHAAGEWEKVREYSREHWLGTNSYLEAMFREMQARRAAGEDADMVIARYWGELEALGKLEIAAPMVEGREWRRMNPFVRENPGLLEELMLPKTADEYLSMLQKSRTRGR